MKKTAFFFLIFLLFSSNAFATSFIDKIEGVYKHRFRNGLVTGEEYESEDIAEILKLSDATAYLRYDLQFYNGHSCSLWGIAEVKNDKLVYTDNTAKDPDNHCVLEVSISEDKLLTDDKTDYIEFNNGCKNYCGVRGSFHKVTFDMKDRRKIRYAKRIKQSPQFKEALENYKNQTTIRKEEN